MGLTMNNKNREIGQSIQNCFLTFHFYFFFKPFLKVFFFFAFPKLFCLINIESYPAIFNRFSTTTVGRQYSNNMIHWVLQYCTVLNSIELYLLMSDGKNKIFKFIFLITEQTVNENTENENEKKSNINQLL